MTQPTPTTLIKSLKDNWFIIVFIASLVVTWTSWGTRLTALEKNQVDQDGMIKHLQEQNAEIKGAIIEIKANYIFIKDTLTDIKNRN